MEEQDEVIIVDERTYKAKTRAKYASLALYLSVGAVSVIGAASMLVLVASFFLKVPAPQWASTAEAAVLTAAVALIFKDRS